MFNLIILSEANDKFHFYFAIIGTLDWCECWVLEWASDETLAKTNIRVFYLKLCSHTYNRPLYVI